MNFHLQPNLEEKMTTFFKKNKKISGPYLPKFRHIFFPQKNGGLFFCFLISKISNQMQKKIKISDKLDLEKSCSQTHGQTDRPHQFHRSFVLCTCPADEGGNKKKTHQKPKHHPMYHLEGKNQN